MPIPDSILNAPELEEGLELYYIAFMDLSDCRAMGMSEGPIPWLAIDRYCLRHGIEGEAADDMIYHVKKLDAHYLSKQRDKMKAQADKPKPKPSMIPQRPSRRR